MKMKRLFNRRSDGDLQTWDLEVVDNKYRVSSGKLGGKIVVNAWTECEGKNIDRANATTPAEQATAEAKALWTKKHNEGYRESEAELSEVTLIEPMLAKKFEDYESELTYPLFCQPKADGIRVIATANGLFTRSGKPHTTLVHIHEALAPVFKKFPGLIIDGEAYSPKLSKDFSRICSLVKRVKPTSAELAECAKHISFHVYDCLEGPMAGKNFAARSAFIEENLKRIPSIKILDTFLIKDRASLDVLYEKFIESGWEGQIIRTNDIYENKRSRFLLKRKTFQDSEYTILGIVEGVGNRAGTVGSMEFKNEDGKLFNSNVKGSWEFVEDLWKNKEKYIGKQATIKYFGLTPGDKIPRFPYVIAIREDGI